MKEVRPVTLKRQMLIYLVLAFLATCGVVALGYSINRKISFNQTLNIEGAKMASSISRQADQILPGLLVMEEFASVALQLTRMKDTETLSDVQYLPKSEFEKKSYGNCVPFNNNNRVRICSHPLNPEVQTIAEVGLPGDTLGHLIKTKSILETGEDKSVVKALGVLLGSIALAFLVLISLILYFIEKHVRRFLLNLHKDLVSILEGQSTSLPSVFRIAEVQSVARQVKDLVSRYEDRKVKAAIGDLAAQVAHDIRSPLSVLSLITSANPNMPDTQRRLLESASARIRNIAEDLLTKYRNDSRPLNMREIAKQTGDPTLILTVIDRIIAEKRALYLDRDFRIHLDVSAAAASSFVAVDTMALARILSNLIDNSMEAMDRTDAQIWIELRESKRRSETLELILEDNGRGIPADVLPKLGKKGASFNKANGTGLGLFYARSVIEAAGGDIIWESEPNSGTRIQIRLPVIPAPEWFTNKIEVRGDQRIVIVDDDPTIHEFLKSRLQGFPIEHCIDDYLSVLTKSANDPFCYFLMDNKLSAKGPTGLDLIQKFYIGSRSTVITSDFDSPEIQRRVINLGCKILPKPLLPYVEIRKISDSKAEHTEYDLVLIDDDELVGMAWKVRAETMNRKLGFFKSLKDVLAKNISTKTPVYIDFHLAPGMTGVQAAIELRDRGFSNLHLATGSAGAELLSLPDFILSVQGKEFPLRSEKL